MPCSAAPFNEALPAASRSPERWPQFTADVDLEGDDGSDDAHAQLATASTVQNSIQTEQKLKPCNDSIHLLPDHSLPERTLDAIRLCLPPFPQLHWLKPYGSRAMGRHWRGPISTSRAVPMRIAAQPCMRPSINCPPPICST